MPKSPKYNRPPGSPSLYFTYPQLENIIYKVNRGHRCEYSVLQSPTTGQYMLLSPVDVVPPTPVGYKFVDTSWNYIPSWATSVTPENPDGLGNLIISEI